MKSRNNLINHYIKEYIDKYDGEFRITYVMLTKYINETYNFKADRNTIANNINIDNLKEIETINKAKKYCPTHNGDHVQRINKIINNFLYESEHKYRIITRHIWQLIVADGINLIEDSVYKYLTKEHKKFIKEHNKPYLKRLKYRNRSKYVYHPRVEHQNMVEIFENKAEFQSKIISLTMTDKIQYVKKHGLIRDLDLSDKYDKNKWAIVYYVTKF